MKGRVSTGISEFDRLIEGGFPRNAMILLAGNPGAGKTIFSARFIYVGAVDYGEPGVYVCFAESRDKFIWDMRRFGIDFEPLIKKGKVAVLDLSIGMEIDVQSAVNQIFEAIASIGVRRLVVDSITAMFAGLKGELEKRHIIRLLYRLIQKSGCTAIVIADMPWGSSRIGSSIEEFIADGVILMESHYNNGVLKRQLSILKMRGTNHTLKTHEYRIGKNGIEIEV